MFCREIKARKAKFGFDLGSLHLSNVVDMGEFVKTLGHTFNYTEYTLEESGWSSSSVVKVYTEIDEVADFIRNYKT